MPIEKHEASIGYNVENKTRNKMKEERLKILDKLSRCEITPEEADKELWDLFSISCRIPKPHEKRIDYANYYIKKYSPQFGLDKSKLEQFMLNFLADEWMSDSNKSYKSQTKAENLPISNVVEQSEQFKCHSCGTSHSGENDDQLYEVCKKCFNGI